MIRICGLDEAGRGPLAGPLVAAAVILNVKFRMYNVKLKDSKQTSKIQREKIFQAIIESGSVVKTEIITTRQINNRGIGWANVEVFKRLIKTVNADKYIVDGNLKIKIKNKNIISVVKADSTSECVMAASIIAKVTRDRLMENFHTEFPQYRWNENMGYGTNSHIIAIKQFGVVKYHRDIFVTTALNKYYE